MYYRAEKEENIRKEVEGKKIRRLVFVGGQIVIVLEDDTMIEIGTDLPASFEVKVSFVDKKR